MKRKGEKRELKEDEAAVVIAVKHCARELADILQGARIKVENDALVFANKDIAFLLKGSESYFDMYKKLGIHSRADLYKVFGKLHNIEQIQDAQEMLEDVEGLWGDFLRNLEIDINLKAQSDLFPRELRVDYSRNITIDVGQILNTEDLFVTDLLNNNEIKLSSILKGHLCTVVLFQPSYLPDITVRWRFDEIQKVKEDYKQFSVKFVVITWGPRQITKDWARGLRRIVDWPIYRDDSKLLLKLFAFKHGLSKIWNHEKLELCGLAKYIHNWDAVNLVALEEEFSWLKWPWIGGEVVLSKEKTNYALNENTYRINSIKEYTTPEVDPITKIPKKKIKDNTIENEPEIPIPVQEKKIITNIPSSSSSSEDDEDSDDETSSSNSSDSSSDSQSNRGNEFKSRIIGGITINGAIPLESSHWYVSIIHRNRTYADMVNPGIVYKAILSATAKRSRLSEMEIMDRVREERQMTTAPDKGRMEKEAGSHLLYDPTTELYYDPKSEYFWNPRGKCYLLWDEKNGRYISANTKIQAQFAEDQIKLLIDSTKNLVKSSMEKMAARQAGDVVAAKLAEIRCAKDEYAAYAYATCMLGSEEAEKYSNNIDYGMTQNRLLPPPPKFHDGPKLYSSFAQNPEENLPPEYDYEAPPPGLV